MHFIRLNSNDQSHCRLDFGLQENKKICVLTEKIKKKKEEVPFGELN